VDWVAKGHAVHDHRYHRPFGVSHAGQSPGLVSQAHDDAAVDIPVQIGVLQTHDLAENHARFRSWLA
jgi:hypothetical protein